MKKPQFIVVVIAVALLSSLYFFAPRYKKSEGVATSQNSENQEITSKSVLEGAKMNLSAEQKLTLLSIENQLIKGISTKDSIRIYQTLSRFWADSAQKLGPYLYYTYSAALLESSEKSLTFAAQQLVDNLTDPEAPPPFLKWMAGNAKVLLDKALVINPNNDSAKINLGACYLFGNISDNPMQGILKIKEVVDKNPHNIYGQMVLALGGKKSGQNEKAIERFLLILKDEPTNIEALVHLAECYELTNQKPLALNCYQKVKQFNKIKSKEFNNAIDKRIQQLKK
ncbi:MAG: tetratricopeptide repeat protein [Sediminibacterium sp.]